MEEAVSFIEICDRLICKRCGDTVQQSNRRISCLLERIDTLESIEHLICLQLCRLELRCVLTQRGIQLCIDLVSNRISLFGNGIYDVLQFVVRKAEKEVRSIGNLHRLRCGQNLLLERCGNTARKKNFLINLGSYRGKNRGNCNIEVIADIKAEAITVLAEKIL